MKKILVCGAGGFIGNHLVSKLKKEGNYVVGADLKLPEYSTSDADHFHIGDLSDQSVCNLVFKLHKYDVVYQLAADMGGAGYIFTGDNDANIMHNSCSINLNVLKNCVEHGIKDILYTSSACIYPEHNQLDPDNPNCEESSAYPANPDSEYGWEKLFSERLYLTFNRNYGLNAKVVRLHNVYGPLGSWNNGKEKAPAAICRKVLTSDGSIEIWGDGEQTRSFMYIDECLTGFEKIIDSDLDIPINLGSDRMVTINELVDIASSIEGKHLVKNHIDGPLGVRGRNSHNDLIEEKLGWKPNTDLEYGIEQTYNWIKGQLGQ